MTDDADRCKHGIRSPWQCDDCDRENPPTQAQLDAILDEARQSVERCDQRIANAAACDQRLMVDP